MNACPSHEIIVALLDETLPQGELAGIVDHIENCLCCQTHLEHLTPGARLSTLRDVVAGSSVSPSSTDVDEACPAGNGAGFAGIDRADVSVGDPAFDVTACVTDPAQEGRPERTSPGIVVGALAPRAGSAEPPVDFPDVAGYQVIERLGHGGMGVVYKARHQGLNRLVALKMIRGGTHARPELFTRFATEAKAIAKLRHAHILQVHDIGRSGGLPFVVLELLDGGSLDDRLARTPQASRWAAELLAALAGAVQFAHEAGIIHRDLKPSNVLYTSDGVPKITDFGLAKWIDSDENHTESGLIMGSPSYMAPEQALGRSKVVGAAADVYALGAILYKMLTGRPPFKGETPMATVHQVIDDEPVPPSQLVPRLPRDLETICLKCLEKDPSRRFATASDLAEDLRRFVEGEPILARPTPAWERAWKWGRRRPSAVAIIGLTAAMLLGTGLFIAWHNVSLRGQLNVALMKERAASQREQDAVEKGRLAQLKQEGQKLFDRARVAVADRDWPRASVDLEKALTTIGYNSRMEDLREPALALLNKANHELRIEADRRASQTRYQKFASTRDEAHFLGTPYTGRDLAANLDAARTSVHAALAVYDVLADGKAEPKLDDYLSSSQKSEVHGDCYQLLLILAETEAQSAPTATPPAKEHYLRKALGILDQARRLGEPSRAFQLRRARYLHVLGDHAEAEQAEQAAKVAGLDRVLDHFLMADELYRCEKFGEATKEFDLVLEDKPGHFWAQYGNAICLLRQQRAAEARRALDACLAQRSDFGPLYLLRGLAQQELQAWGAADSDFQKAAHLPLDDNARYALFVSRGVLLIRQERFKEAVADLDSAIELKPKWYQAYVNLAQAYRRLDKMDRALDQLNRAVELEPGLAQVYRLRAKLHVERNEPLLALDNFNQAIRRENANGRDRVDDHVERGLLLLSERNSAEALACAHAALALQKDHPLAQRLRAECLLRLRRFEEAIAAFDQYRVIGKPLESIYRGRGLARAELGQYPGAIEDFTKALELDPTSAVQAYRGWTHLVVDAPKLALRDFELAIELDPGLDHAYSGRGLARMHLGRWRDAMADVDTAVKLATTDHKQQALQYAAWVHSLASRYAAEEASPRGEATSTESARLRENPLAILLDPARQRTRSKHTGFWRDVLGADPLLPAFVP